MQVTIRVADCPDGKVEIECNAPAPKIGEMVEMSALVAWYMLFTAQTLLLNSPVRRVVYNPTL